METKTTPIVGSMQYDLANNLAPGTSSSGNYRAPAIPQLPPSSPTEPITSAKLAPVVSLPLPDKGNTALTAANYAIGAAQGVNDSVIKDLDAEAKAAEVKANDRSAVIDKYIGQYEGRGAEQSAAEDAAGIPALRTTARNLSDEYNLKTLAYNQQYKAISQDASLSVDQRARQLAAVTNDHAYDQTDLAIRSNIANGNYTAAQALVDKKIDIKYGDLKDLITFQSALLSDDRADMTEAKRNKLQIQLDENRRKLDDITYKERELQKTKTELLKTANAQNAPEDVKNAIQSATDETLAINAAGPYAVDMLERQYKQAQIDKMYFEMTPTDSGNKVSIPGLGLVNGNAAALARDFATTGNLPTPADLKAAGTTFEEVTRIAKESPKYEGAVVDIASGVKSASIPAAAQEDFSRLYNVTKLATQLKALDEERIGGLVGGVTGKVFGAADQAKYLTTRKAIVDEISRMQSGAALTLDEVAFYEDYLPGRFSESFFLGQDSGKKIDNFISVMDEKLSNRLSNNGLSIYGYSKVNVEGKEYTVGDIIDNGSGKKGRVNPDGTITVQNDGSEDNKEVSTTAGNRPQRNNNPLNIKESSFTKEFPGVAGTDPKPATDGGKFLTFETPEAGFDAAKKLITSKNYKNLTVDAALKRWSGNGYGAEVAPKLKGKKIQDLSEAELKELINSMAAREGYFA